MDSTSVFHVSAVVGSLIALWAIISPAVASWITAQFNKGTGWLATRPNWEKTLFYFGLNLVLQLLGSFADYSVGTDPASYNQAFWTGLVGALGGTIIYKLGHKTPKSPEVVSTEISG